MSLSRISCTIYILFARWDLFGTAPCVQVCRAGSVVGYMALAQHITRANANVGSRLSRSRSAGYVKALVFLRLIEGLTWHLGTIADRGRKCCLEVGVVEKHKRRPLNAGRHDLVHRRPASDKSAARLAGSLTRTRCGLPPHSSL